jgi:hypothetical protein
MATYLDPMYDLLLKYGVAGDDADRLHVIEIVVFVSLLCLCIILGHLLEENRWMNESITALLLVSVCFYSIYSCHDPQISSQKIDDEHMSASECFLHFLLGFDDHEMDFGTCTHAIGTKFSRRDSEKKRS